MLLGRLGLVGALAAALAMEAPAGQEVRRFDPAGHLQPQSRDYWKPRAAAADDSLLGALGQLAAARQDYLLLKSRGVMRPFYFHYRNFSSERDFFNAYQGFRLHGFMDGKLELGLYKHRAYHGVVSGPSGAVLPSHSNRIEFVLRWHLNER
jgi:hypothetical protein